MATLLGALRFDIEGDTSKLNKSVEESEGLIRKLGRGIGDVSKIAAGFVIGNAITKLPGVLMGSVNAASDFEESLSKVGVVFDQDAAKVTAWSKTTATSLGISQQAALSAAGTYGNLFRALGLTSEASAKMSMDTVNLAADLASFNNMDPTEVLDKLRAGLLGETEPLKSLGVALSQAQLEAKMLEMGMEKVNGEFTEADKVAARYALILEQTSLAHGDFARTADGNANQMRILNAQWKDAQVILGQALLPIFVAIGGILVGTFLPALATGITYFAEWISLGIEIGTMLAGIAWDSVQPLAEAGFDGLRAAADALRPIAWEVVSTAWSVIASVASLSWDALTALFDAIAAPAWSAIENAWSVIRDAGSIAWGAAQDAWQRLVELATVAWPDIKAAMDAIAAVGWAQVQSAWDSILASGTGVPWDKIRDTSAQFGSDATNVNNYRDAWEKLVDVMKPAADVLLPLVERVLRAADDAIKDVTDSNRDLINAMRDFLAALRPLEPVIRPLAYAIGTVLVLAIGAALLGLEGMINFIKFTLIAPLELLTLTFQTLTRGIDLLRLAVDSMVDVARTIAEPFETAADAVQSLIDKINSIPTPSLPDIPGIPGIGNPFRASGGPVQVGGTYIVGEDGPELFSPSSNGYIIPNGQFGGPSLTANITINGSADGNDLRRALDKWWNEKLRSEFGFGATTYGRRSRTA